MINPRVHHMSNYIGEVNVTVIVHTVNVPGGPNQGADMNFIKLFTQVSHGLLV